MSEAESSEMSTLRATQILKIIPDYYGRPNENVHEFIDAVEEGFNLVKKEDTKVLLAFLRTKLKGPAFKAIQYLSIDSWKQLKEHLQRRFGVGDTIGYLEKEFTLLTQKHKETVAEFGERTCALAAKITEYNIREKGYDADTFQKIMEDRILVQFVTGLLEPVRFQLKTYRCTEYQEALNIACNLERESQSQGFDSRNYLKKIGLRDQNSYTDRPKCFNCGKQGHKSRDCYFKQEKHSSAQVKVVQCYNCNKMGHIAKFCRSKGFKKYPDTRPQETQNQGNGNHLSATSRPGRPAQQYKSAQ